MFIVKWIRGDQSPQRPKKVVQYYHNGVKITKQQHQKITNQQVPVTTSQNYSQSNYGQNLGSQYQHYPSNYYVNEHSSKNQGNQASNRIHRNKSPNTYQRRSPQNFNQRNPTPDKPSANKQQTFFQVNQHNSVGFSIGVPKNNNIISEDNIRVQPKQFDNPRISIKEQHKGQSKHQNFSHSPSNRQNHQKMDIQLQREQEDLKAQKASLNQLVRSYQKRIQEAEAFGKKMKDPRKFKEFQAEALANYIEKINEMNLPEQTQNQQGVSQKLIIGKIASGKSSLINSYFGTNEEVGLGDTTTESKVVFETEKKDVQIIDNPGVSENFDIRSVDLIKYIASSSEIYVLYPDSLKSIENLIRVIAAIKPNHLYLLRNQCDRFNKNQVKTLQQEIAEDKKILEKWNIGHLPIFATSSVMPNDFDNEKVKKMMMSKPKKIQQKFK